MLLLMKDPYKALREEAFEANRAIPRLNLALFTWGNASAFDGAAFAIKPSGIPYDELAPESMVVLDLEGARICGALAASSDAETHRVLYRSFPGIRGVVHTHSTYAAAWAQARRDVPLLGTTHADHAATPIPCTPFLERGALKRGYERETGELILQTFRRRGLNHEETPMALVAGHGPFVWGRGAREAVYHAAVLEEICRMAALALGINPQAQSLPAHLARAHWERKHGSTAYYGQPAPVGPETPA
jgi:L-ribulose-5-phosphate 4-epimerase